MIMMLGVPKASNVVSTCKRINHLERAPPQITLGNFEDLKKQLAERKRTGINQESRSLDVSNIVVVQKKNGSIKNRNG